MEVHNDDFLDQINAEAKTDYSGEAYRACLAGNADRRQQASAASQIILLHGIKGELVAALEALMKRNSAENRGRAARVIGKAAEGRSNE